MVFRGGEVRAGSRGRCDVAVSLELTEAGGLVLETTGSFDGDSGRVEAVVREVLGEQGIENARALLEMGGAEEFVLRARLETAAVRALKRNGGERP